MNIKSVFLMLSVLLLGAFAMAAPTADTVENDAEAGWAITPGNTTYLDFPFPTLDGGYTYTRNGLTLTRDAVDDWTDATDPGAPDTSNYDDFVNGGMDDKLRNTASDFSITITGLTPYTEYGIAITIKGNTNHPADCDFAWGTQDNGAPVNAIEGIAGQPNGVILSGNNMTNGDEVFALPFYRATSDQNGSIVVWIGKNGQGWNEDTRTQIDGVLVGTEILPEKAWIPDPEDGAISILGTTDLSWGVPSGADETWSYKVYIDTDSDPSDATPITVTDANVPNSVMGTLNSGDYWWRVDSLDPNALVPGGYDVRTGDVWTFNVAAVPLPELVSPEDGVGGNGFEFYLEWLSDNTSGLIQKHRLVLNNLTDGTSASIDLSEDKYHYWFGDDEVAGVPSPLWDIIFYGKDYSWQIIELGAGDGILAVGPEWHVSTVALQCSGLSVYGDATGDCKVTLDDVAAVGASWLECGWRLPNGGKITEYFADKDPCGW